jgi:hypothetical protein
LGSPLAELDTKLETISYLENQLLSSGESQGFVEFQVVACSEGSS